VGKKKKKKKKKKKMKRFVANLDAFRYLTAINKSQGPAELVHCNVVKVTVSSGHCAALLGGNAAKTEASGSPAPTESFHLQEGRRKKVHDNKRQNSRPRNRW
jgi:hypothetical protein